MSLPASRNTTYAPGSEVLSADLNDIQDQIIDLAAPTLIIPPPAGRSSTWTESPSGANWTSADGSGTHQLNFFFHLPVGYRIVSVNFVVKDAAATSKVNCNLQKTTPTLGGTGSTSATIVSNVASDGSGNWQVVTCTPASPETIAQGTLYQGQVITNGVGVGTRTVHHLYVVLDKV